MENLAYIISGLTLLILGGDWLLKAAVGMSLCLKIPKIVIGMTVVSFATSAPELVVSLKAALDGHADLSVSNVIGSNIVNIGLVLGIVLMLGPIYVQSSFYKIDWPMMMGASLLFYFFVISDSLLEAHEGIIMVVIIIAFLVYLLKFNQNAVIIDEFPDENDSMSKYKIIFLFFIGGIALWLGSEFLVNGAVGMARYYKISERVIGLTMVSIGTGLPELSASVIAVLKKEKAISIGNIIGSNVFNILVVLGVTSILTPIPILDASLLSSDIYWMLLFSVLLFPLVLVFPKMKLGWRDGLVFLVLYGVFLLNV